MNSIFNSGRLPYFKSFYPLDEDLKNLPAIIFTSDVDWDPTIYDSCPDELVTEEFEVGLYSDNFTSRENCEISIFEIMRHLT